MFNQIAANLKCLSSNSKLLRKRIERQSRHQLKEMFLTTSSTLLNLTKRLVVQKLSISSPFRRKIEEEKY